jgi:hypothetical protein
VDLKHDEWIARETLLISTSFDFDSTAAEVIDEPQLATNFIGHFARSDSLASFVFGRRALAFC